MIRNENHMNPEIGNQNVEYKGVQYERNPDAEYGEHIQNTGAICNTSASHTYGNVLAIIQKYLVDQFPPEFFKTITASTTLASKQVRHLPNQLIKLESPMMVLIPRIVFGQDDNRFLSHTLINDTITNTHAIYGDGSLIPLAKDVQRRLYVHGHYNRALMYVDVVLTFNTYNEQVNYMSYINNMLGVGHNRFVRAPLELFIPMDFCDLISKISRVPKVDANNSVHDYLHYMNTIWDYPITYKLKGGSNTDEFFMYYITDIDTVVQDVQAGAGIKDGQIKRAYDITFTIRCEFNTIGYFTLNAPDIKKNINLRYQDDTHITTMLTDVINLKDFDVPIGWTVLSWPVFKLNPNENSVDINPILNHSINTVIDHHLKFSIPMERFIRIQFREDGRILTNELFYIDWVNRKLILLNPNPRRTYRLIITVSPEYVNNLIKNMYNLE